MKPVTLFYSYSHKDKKLRADLDTHLTSLKRQGLLAAWFDGEIIPGAEWRVEIDKWLAKADIILLLVSADFLASDFCWGVELRTAMERHASGKATVIPIILRPCEWETAPFGKLQVLPENRTAVITWERPDEAWLTVAQGLRRILLQRPKGPSRAEEMDSKSGLRRQQTKKERGKKRILVVDDDDIWLQTTELILGESYELKLTTDPSEAVSLIKSTSFSLAILDQRISVEVSGIDLSIQLRNIRRGLRVIILTGYAELDDAVESMKRGATDYISKGRTDLADQLRIIVARAVEESTPEAMVAALIKNGESAELEFRASARWDMQLATANKDIEAIILRTVAAFLNSEAGGVLLIGVDDSGEIVGLQHDYKTLSKQDREGLENFLISLMLGVYGREVSPLISIDFYDIDGKDVCRISARPSPRPVYVNEGVGRELYIRIGPATRRLSLPEAIEYSKIRWRDNV